MAVPQTSKGLLKPDGTEFQTTDQFNQNSDRLNSFGMGPYVCTSTTRPTGSNLWTGLNIFETDTKTLLMYDGSDWVPVAPGGYYSKSVLASDANIPNTTITIVGVGITPAFTTEAKGIVYSTVDGSFTVPLPGLYKISVNGVFGINGSGSREFYISLNNAGGTGPRLIDCTTQASSIVSGMVQFSQNVRLAKNDKLYLCCYHNAGSTIPLAGVSGNFTFTQMAIEYVRS